MRYTRWTGLISAHLFYLEKTWQKKKKFKQQQAKLIQIQ